MNPTGIYRNCIVCTWKQEQIYAPVNVYKCPGFPRKVFDLTKTFAHALERDACSYPADPADDSTGSQLG